MLQIFGQIDPSLTQYGDIDYKAGTLGLTGLLSNLISLIIGIAGIYVIINFILAGYQYLSSNNEPQKISQAGNKILQTIIGITIIATTYIIAAIIGHLFYQDPTILFRLDLFSIL